MRRYIGTKVINAKPMTRGDYNGLRGWTVPADENPADPGFLVEYTDGGTANVEGFAGYVSWSPADVFARSYDWRPALPGIQPHEQRVLDERNELAGRLDRLSAFFESPAFMALTQEERTDLAQQKALMHALAITLTRRILRFLPTTPPPEA